MNKLIYITLGALCIFFTSCSKKASALTTNEVKTEENVTAESVTDETEQKIPDWMGNSVILYSNMLYGQNKTINDLFSNPKETTIIKNKVSKDALTINSEMKADGELSLKLDVSFKFQNTGDIKTCYISKITFASSMSKETLECKNGPNSDLKKYGQMLGMLYEAVPIMYD